MRNGFLLGLLAIGLYGCASGLIEEKPAAVYYELEYPGTPFTCPQPFGRGVKIWNLTVAAPFDRTEMVVEKPGGEVQISQGFQWVAQPGRMLAEQLVRDIGLAGLFPRTIAGENAASMPLDLTGRIYEFAWERSEKGSRAILNAEFSLVNAGAGEVIFHRTYRLQSALLGTDNAGTFAKAMSRLVEELSVKLQQDLCEAKGGD